MDPCAVVPAHIDQRGEIVEVAASESDDRDRELPHRLFVGMPAGDALRPATPVDEEPIHAVHEHVGDLGVGKVR